MKQRFFAILLALALLLSGCAAQKSEPSADILATTAPVAQIVGAITAGTDLTVATLISEPVSCVHDYALSVAQMRAVEPAKLIEAVRLAVIRQQGMNHLAPEQIPELLDDELPQQAITSAFRKYRK